MTRTVTSRLGACWLLGLAACANEKASAIVVAISSELSVPGEINQLSVKADRAGAPRFDQSYALPSGAPLPGTLTFVDDGGEGPVTVVVRGIDGKTGEAVEKKARFTIPKQSTRLVRVRLDRACLGVVCGPTDSCDAGRCVPVPTLEGSGLPPYTDDGDAFRPAGCFDEAACSVGARPLTVTGDTCQVDAMPGESVFVMWKQAPGQPVVTLVEGTPARLPASLCQAYTRGDVTLVLAGSACAPYAADRALCVGPPPSGVGGAGGQGVAGTGGAGAGQAGVGGAGQAGGGGSGKGGVGGAGQAGVGGGGKGGVGGAGQAGVGGAGQAGVGGAGQAGVGGAGQAGVGGAGQAGVGGAGQAGVGGAGQAGVGGAGQGGVGGAGQAGVGGAGQAGAGGAGQAGAAGAGASPPGPVVQLSGAQERMCALVGNPGDVYCWGMNSPAASVFGGAITESRVGLPTKVPGASSLSSFSVGSQHACGVDAAKGLLCWGTNDAFAAGGPSNGGVIAPTSVAGVADAVEVAAGYRQTCFRTTPGAVHCFGEVLGGAASLTPQTMPGPAGQSSVALATSTASQPLTCSLDTSGNVHCWGNASPVSLPSPTLNPKATMLAVTRLDEVFVANNAGVQRSVFTTGWSAFTDVPKGALTGAIQSLSAGAEVCVTTSPGPLFCIDDPFGTLTPGGFVERTGVGAASAVAAAWSPLHPEAFSCAAAGPDVLCWGDDLAGEIGIGLPHLISTPTASGLTGVLSLSTATATVLAKKGAGWQRSGVSRSLRAGANDASTSFVPIPALDGATNVWVGDQEVGMQAYAVFSPGDARRYDSLANTFSAGGLLDAGTDWKEMRFHGNRVLGLTSTGQLYSHGPTSATVDDLLGTGIAPDGSPHLIATGLIGVSGFDTFRDVYANFTHACAWDTGNGASTCWGGNDVGQAGIDPGSAASFSVPPSPAVANLPPTKGMCTGWDHTCSIGSDDIVRCWGSDYVGQLGRGTGVGSDWQPVPVVLAGGGNLTATSLTCGFTHTCALGADAKVRCWGANGDGQLGRGTLTLNESLAGEVPTLADVQEIMAGPDYVCAIVGAASRELRCWGSAYWGQLGLGFKGFSLPPTKTVW